MFGDGAFVGKGARNNCAVRLRIPLHGLVGIVNAPDFTEILYSFNPYGVRTHVRRFCIINDSVRHTEANVAESERGKVAS